jgi:hypothetical protein
MLNREQVLSIVSDLEALRPDVEELEAFRAKRTELEAEVARLERLVAGLRAERAEAIKSQRFELENTTRDLARVNQERDVALADLGRIQADFAKLVVEMKGLRKQL